MAATEINFSPKGNARVLTVPSETFPFRADLAQTPSMISKERHTIKQNQNVRTIKIERPVLNGVRSPAKQRSFAMPSKSFSRFSDKKTRKKKSPKNRKIKTKIIPRGKIRALTLAAYLNFIRF